MSFLIKKFFELCELSASMVNPSSQETRNNRKFSERSILRSNFHRRPA